MSTTQPELSDRDLAYVTEEYRTLEQLCAARAQAQAPQTPHDVRALIDAGSLPAATYRLPDGTALFPPDYFALLDGAGGVDALPEHFTQRHRAAASALGLGMDEAEDWRGYLSGEFGACLREVTPEAMVEKAALIAEIDRLVAVPAVEDEKWRKELAEAVDDLDELLRPFTDFDRQRWGSTSRDSHVTAIRARFLDG